MSTTHHRLAILDWGIGGLGFYKLLKSRHPDLPVLYFSDAGAVPYGRLSEPLLAERLRVVMRHLSERGVDRVVVACNAASTVLPLLRHDTTLPGVIGVIEHGIGAVREKGVGSREKGRNNEVGVIGGERTIRSGVYGRALRGDGYRVVQRVAQPLSALIERGEIDSPALHAALARILAPLCDVDLLLLACTHYAAITDAIERHLPDAVIIDPIDGMMRWIEREWELAGGEGEDLFLTSGDSGEMIDAAWKAFGVKIGTAHTCLAPTQ